jgi:hypothetical protein
MEEVIKKIIEIEDQAQKIIDDAIEEKKAKETEHEKRLIDLEASIINDAKKKVVQVREREFLEIKEQEEAKIEKCEIQLKKMDENAAKMMDQWVSELVKRVLT